MPTVAVIPLDTTSAVGNNNPLVSTYTYNVDAGSKIFGSVNTQTDTSGYVAKYFYDANNGNLLATVGGKTGDSTYDQGYAYTYDAVGRITNVYPASCSATATSATANTNSASAAYSYNAQSRLSSIVTATTTYNFTYDMFGKSLSVSAGDNILVSYTYKYIEDSDNNKVDVNGKLETETYANNFSVKYVYDTLDRVKESGIIKIQYTYDSLSQLIREDNAYADHSYTYEYDGNGNITTKKTYAYTTGTLGSVEDTVTYSYGNSDWKDLLTSYDGTTISYDASGNPLNWNDERTITWVGRQLDSIMSPDGARWAFKYDHNGLRTEREYSYSGEVILRSEYTWVDEKLVKEERRDGMNTLLITLEYFYNDEDLIGFSIQEGDAAAVNYYYGKTNNGEIRFIYDANGEIVTTYLYDAWGAPISMSGSLASTVGATNPFRYKSYYYDSETRLYYLRSRSYDPAVGRFLNADSTDYLGATGTVLSFNLFAYCENNAVNKIDTYGNMSIYSIKNMVLVIIKGLINKIRKLIEQIKFTYKYGILVIPTGFIAIAIDAISYALSKVSFFAMKTGLQFLVAWAKSKPARFIPFAKQYIINNATKIVESFLNFICIKLAVSVTWSRFTNKVGDILFGSYTIYRVYSAFSSMGNIIATVIDLLDGKWDDKLQIKLK